MITTTKKLKILLYGNVFIRDHRSKALMSFLSEAGHCISQVSPGFYRTKEIKHFFDREKLFIVFAWIELFIKAACADVIYITPMNARFIESALWAKKTFNKKLVVELYISLYDTLVRDRCMVKDGSRQAKTWRKKDVLALTESDYIIHTAQQELIYWEEILNVHIEKDKVFIAPNCNTFSLALKRKFMQDGVLRICWWGTFIPLHGLDNILQAMKILSQQKVLFSCELFGVDNTFFEVYCQKIINLGIETKVNLRKDLSFTDNSLPKYLVDNCDLALGIFGNTDKARNAVPNKLIEALSMGIPALTMNSPGLKEFFNPETELWTCEAFPESIAASIRKIAEGVARTVDWEQTRQKVLTTFSMTQYQEVVTKVLEKVIEDSSAVKSSNTESRVFVTTQAALNEGNCNR